MTSPSEGAAAFHGVQCEATLSKWTAAWLERFQLSTTSAQLALRIAELRTSLMSAGGMRPCTKIQAHGMPTREQQQSFP